MTPTKVWTEFHLACGCILDGCEDSDPGKKWTAGERNGALFCPHHNEWARLVDMVTPEQALNDSAEDLRRLELELQEYEWEMTHG